MSAAKVARQLTLLQVLLEAPRPRTAEEIRGLVSGYSAEKAAFRRTFERDKVDLAELLGHPIGAEPVPGTDPPAEGYRLRPEDTFLRDPGLSEDERRAVAVATSAVRLAGLDPRRAVSKVGAEAPEVASGPVETELPADSRVITLFQAVAGRRPTRFRYRDEDRLVHPLRLRFARGRWYLSAFDTGRDDERLFRLDRIEGEVTTGEPDGFVGRPPRDEGRLDEPWALGSAPAEEVWVRIDPARAEAARRSAPDAVAEDDPDGGVRLRLSVRNRAALRSFVLGFGDEAEVLSPPEVRADMVEWLRAIAERDG